jgi:hypothetical protein
MKIQWQVSVAKGNFYHEDKVAFGPAFLDAYRIETTIADFPRVVLSREVYEDVIKYEKSHSKEFEERIGVRPGGLINLADDGPAFIHIFHDFVSHPNARDTERWERRAQIITRLLRNARHDPHRYKKLRWLAIYWNSTVGPGSEFAVSLTDDRLGANTKVEQ